MSDDKLHKADLIKHFKDIPAFKVSDIDQFYKRFTPDLKRGTLDWRIYELVKQGIITRIGRGIYTLGKERKYEPDLSLALKQLFGKLKNEFPYTNICVWTTRWLVGWMIHMPSTFFTIIETERDSEESLFFYLRDTRKNVFLNPSLGTLYKYAEPDKDVILVKTLVSQAPVREKENTIIPELEKILVDLVADEGYADIFQGRDLLEIYSNAQSQFSINESRLLRYAKRRTREEQVLKLIKETK